MHGPTTGVQRQTIPLKRLSMTNIKLNIPRGLRLKGLLKAIKAQDLEGQWNKTSWARKIAIRKKRAETTDFERFKLLVARRTVCPPFSSPPPRPVFVFGSLNAASRLRARSQSPFSVPILPPMRFLLSLNMSSHSGNRLS